MLILPLCSVTGSTGRNRLRFSPLHELFLRASFEATVKLFSPPCSALMLGKRDRLRSEQRPGRLSPGLHGAASLSDPLPAGPGRAAPHRRWAPRPRKERPNRAGKRPRARHKTLFPLFQRGEPERLSSL